MRRQRGGTPRNSDSARLHRHLALYQTALAAAACGAPASAPRGSLCFSTALRLPLFLLRPFLLGRAGVGCCGGRGVGLAHGASAAPAARRRLLLGRLLFLRRLSVLCRLSLLDVLVVLAAGAHIGAGVAAGAALASRRVVELLDRFLEALLRGVLVARLLLLRVRLVRPVRLRSAPRGLPGRREG